MFNEHQLTHILSG